MTKRVTLCDGCGQPLGAARLVVNVSIVNGVEAPAGTYHVDRACFTDAVGRHQGVQSKPSSSLVGGVSDVC